MGMIIQAMEAKAVLERASFACPQCTRCLVGEQRWSS